MSPAKDMAAYMRQRRAWRRAWRAVYEGPVPCAGCGHQRRDHDHHHAGTACSVADCGCRRYRRTNPTRGSST